jgi:hypothetical protein
MPQNIDVLSFADQNSYSVNTEPWRKEDPYILEKYENGEDNHEQSSLFPAIEYSLHVSIKIV